MTGTCMPTGPGTGRLPNAPLLRAFRDSELSTSEVCRRLDWYYTRGNGSPTADTTKLSRALGTAPHIGGSRHTGRTQTITAEWAQQIAAALGVEMLDLYPAMADEDGTPCRQCGDPLWTLTTEGVCGFCIEEREMAVA